MLFLPERPYLPPGTLRDALLPPGRERAIGDEQIATLLRDLHVDGILERVGGLDVERDWDDVLSLTEQKLLSVARVVLVAPIFVFLERPRASLGAEQADRIMKLFRERSITYLTLGDGDERLSAHDFVLELANDGDWTLQPGDGVSPRAAPAWC